jgi:hypothetical protein
MVGPTSYHAESHRPILYSTSISKPGFGKHLGIISGEVSQWLSQEGFGNSWISNPGGRS